MPTLSTLWANAASRITGQTTGSRQVRGKQNYGKYNLTHWIKHQEWYSLAYLHMAKAGQTPLLSAQNSVFQGYIQ